MIVNECITGQDKKAYEQKLGEDLSTDKILDEEYQLIKKHLFSSPNSRLLMDSKLSFEGIVCTWVASTPNLTGTQPLSAESRKVGYSAGSAVRS